MSYKKEAYKLKAESIIKNFKKRKINGFYCESKNEALQKALELIEKGSTVSWGGSTTIQEVGLLDAVKDGEYEVIDRDTASNPEERWEIMRKSFFADTYITSSNALTIDGELVNIDGNGNRVAAMSFGPKKVIIIVGMNKIVDNLDCAVKRVQNEAAPPNVQRLNLNTSCSKTGYCMDCYTDDCVCGQILITRYNRVKDRINVIIVGEELGF
ncbi:MAG TPA: lactate utilization protein [Clostridiales bacterium]|jgi:L-lactate utilization protein LutB|nr:lactate utilization protein [Clostridiales bacterium]